MKRQIFRYNGNFELECGEVLDGLTLCYHISQDFIKSEKCGDSLADGRKVVWITHALTANSNPCEWWDNLVGEGKFLDPRKYIIVCANIIGSPYGSTSPLSINSATGRPYMLGFPKITIRDIVKSLELLRMELGIGSIDLLIGGSVGGFQALEWSISAGDVIKNALFIACNTAVTPWNIAYNEAQKMALQADSSFEEQSYSIADGGLVTANGGLRGMAAARAIALISYRSYTGYNTTQRENGCETLWNHRAASYQRHQGEKLVKRFNAYSYNSMLTLFESHNIARGRGSLEKALRMIKANVVAVGIDSDSLFPPHEQRFIADNTDKGLFREMTSVFGHDGFLLEWQQLSAIIKEII